MCEIDNFYSRLIKPEGVTDADEQAEINELERLRKEVARKRRREEIEALRRELTRAPCAVRL